MLTALLAVVAVAAAIGAVLVWWGYLNARAVRVERPRIALESLPAELEGLRIMLLSDLHLPGISNAPERLLNLVRAEGAAVTLIAGDIVDTQAGADVGIAVAAELARVRPTYAVFGSHDHYERKFSLSHFPRSVFEVNDAQSFRRELEARGVTVLQNERIDLKVGTASFQLIGVDDPYIGLDDLDGAASGAEGFTILLSHSPDILPAAARRGIPLVLSGHTHGGQIALPFFGPPLTHSKLFRRRQPAGLKRDGGTVVYVGRGFGTTTLPLRFNAPPEVTVITLVRAETV